MMEIGPKLFLENYKKDKLAFSDNSNTAGPVCYSVLWVKKSPGEKLDNLFVIGTSTEFLGINLIGSFYKLNSSTIKQ